MSTGWSSVAEDGLIVEVGVRPLDDRKLLEGVADVAIEELAELLEMFSSLHVRCEELPWFEWDLGLSVLDWFSAKNPPYETGALKRTEFWTSVTPRRVPPQWPHPNFCWWVEHRGAAGFSVEWRDTPGGPTEAWPWTKVSAVLRALDPMQVMVPLAAEYRRLGGAASIAAAARTLTARPNRLVR